MNDISPPNDNTSEIAFETLLSAEKRGGRRRWRWALVMLPVLLLVAGYFLLRGSGDSGEPRYLVEKVARDTLIVTVTATGNLEPTNKVEVGSEMSGTIDAVYVDDDDRVSKGQVLAVLDLSKFEDAVAKSRATVQAAEASLQQAGATVEETRLKLQRYRKVRDLSNGKVPSSTEMETAEAEYSRAQANLASARASIAEAKAALRSDETNLDKAHIRSPIDGVVLERAVDPGQAVAASLQAVTLFTLAEDLSQMELEVDVDEADVGQVKAGLKARFTVDAWPDRTFEATITRVGFNAADDDGVISYPAVLQVDNNDLILRPGMTATAVITTVTRKDALLVPNAALRFSPSEAAPAKSSGRGLVGSLIPRPPRPTQKPQGSAGTQNGLQRVWVLRDGQAVSVQVKAGATNGRYTEILGDELQEGVEVITEMLSSKS
ncbi:efflux RND transporter periplasmic adaptor subunit [Syntrophotalea acetylenica]|uniref:efflux RND transporter periplasmic adaptor subunit n=1 Tax=Syntrophotalea acetylenica TaxID=29542 RepID=UPI002A371C3B|nr:efflux RND transporter periplasmic adaptor subunit [Syntrophotalea acetylenica]MDY0261965.1 efflux RND transporter periplasmic adaptor subunit [Syntrophotalea acetylenica]